MKTLGNVWQTVLKASMTINRGKNMFKFNLAEVFQRELPMGSWAILTFLNGQSVEFYARFGDWYKITFAWMKPDAAKERP